MKSKKLSNKILHSLAATSLLVAGGFSQNLQAGPAYTVVVGGLHSPRGLAFGPGDRLYVAEAGGVAGHSSAIDEIVNPASAHASLRVIASGFSSTSEVGVDGISVQGNGSIYAITGESVPSDGAGFGTLFKVTPSGNVKAVADIGTPNYTWTGDHPELDPGSQYPDSNPYGVLALPSHTYVVDAGANTLTEVLANGQVKILAYFDNNITADSTPTAVVLGPDGALYVGVLALVDSFAFGPSAKIYRIPIADLPVDGSVAMIGAEQEWTTGLSPINGMAFGPDGSLYVAEIFAHSNPQNIMGDVVKIPFNDPSSHISLTGDSLPFPGGVAVARDGTVYAVGGAVFPNGFVARLSQR